MKFGLVLGQDRNPARLAINAKSAEAAGFDSLWMGDHVGLPDVYKSKYPYTTPQGNTGRWSRSPETTLMDPLMTFAFLAGQTTTIKFATGVYLVPMRHPIAVARLVCTLDHLCGGRFLFGVGVGWNKEEFEWVGAKFEDRGQRMNEAIEVMIELWTKENPVYHGASVQSEGFRFIPKPVQQPHPPFIMGGNSEAMFRRAAKFGAGMYLVCSDRDANVASEIARLRKVEKEVGRAKPLEVTIGFADGAIPTPDEVKRVKELGADRVLITLPETLQRVQEQDMAASIARFRETVIDKV